MCTFKSVTSNCKSLIVSSSFAAAVASILNSYAAFSASVFPPKILTPAFLINENNPMFLYFLRFND